MLLKICKIGKVIFIPGHKLYDSFDEIYDKVENGIDDNTESFAFVFAIAIFISIMKTFGTGIIAFIFNAWATCVGCFMAVAILKQLCDVARAFNKIIFGLYNCIYCKCERTIKKDEERRRAEEDRLQREEQMRRAQERHQREEEARRAQEKRQREEEARRAQERCQREEESRRAQEKRQREERAKRDRQRRERKASCYESAYDKALKLFGLSEGYNEIELKRKWKELIKTCHPDKNLGNVEEFTRKSQDVNAAYRLLSERFKKTA